MSGERLKGELTLPSGHDVCDMLMEKGFITNVKPQYPLPSSQLSPPSTNPTSPALLSSAVSSPARPSSALASPAVMSSAANAVDSSAGGDGLPVNTNWADYMDKLTQEGAIPASLGRHLLMLGFIWDCSKHLCSCRRVYVHLCKLT